MGRQTQTEDADELAKVENVDAVKRSGQPNVAFVAECASGDIRQVTIQLLKSSKWSPVGTFVNEKHPENSLVKVTYSS